MSYPRDDSSPASSCRLFSSPATPSPIYHLFHHTAFRDPSNHLTSSRRAGDEAWGADRHPQSSSPGDVGSSPALREGEQLAGGLPCPRSAQSSVAPHHHHPAQRRDRPQADRTGGRRGDAGRASPPPPPHPSPSAFPGPKFRPFPRMQKERLTGQGGGRRLSAETKPGGTPRFAIPLLGYVISSPALLFPLRKNWEISLQNHEISPRRKKECVNSMSSQHNQPLPQRKKRFSAKKMGS